MLFLTNSQHHHAKRSAQLDPNIQAWNAVELAAGVPFFLVDIGWPEDGHLVIEQQLMHDASALAALVARREAGEIKHLVVNLISPSWMNQFKGWRMYPLREVWCRDGKPAHDLNNLRYVTESVDLPVQPGDEPHQQWTLLVRFD